MDAIVDSLDNLEELYGEQAVLGHPLRRDIEVPAAGVLIRVLLSRPHAGVHLLEIVDI